MMAPPPRPPAMAPPLTPRRSSTFVLSRLPSSLMLLCFYCRCRFIANYTKISSFFAISSKFNTFVALQPECPNGGIGRRVGLKIQCPLKTCRFEPRSGHATEVSLVLGRLLLFPSLQLLGFLIDNVKHLVVGLGSIIISVKFNLFGKHRTK